MTLKISLLCFLLQLGAVCGSSLSNVAHQVVELNLSSIFTSRGIDLKTFLQSAREVNNESTLFTAKESFYSTLQRETDLTKLDAISREEVLVLHKFYECKGRLETVPVSTNIKPEVAQKLTELETFLKNQTSRM